MSKKCYRFFGGLLNAQANWLNKMSEKGYRRPKKAIDLSGQGGCSMNLKNAVLMK